MAAKKDNLKSAKSQIMAEKMSKEDALSKAMENINKEYGMGAIIRLGDQEKLDIEVIPTGSIALDSALGIGGIPKGRITEIYGPESSGKTTVALHIIAECQKQGGTVAFIDAEHALDPAYAKKIGVNIDSLLVSQPDNGEQALEVADALVRSGAVDLIVVDSVAALTPRAEIDGEMGDTHVGLLARLMSQAMRKLTANISNANSTVIFINQIREKVGISYGSPEVTTGGRALKFYSSVRMEVRKGETLKQGTEAIGSRTKVKIAKNKVAPPFKSVEFDIIYGEGISREGSVLDVAASLDIVKKSGAWYSYEGDKLGQGRDNAKEFLKNNPELIAEIEEKIRESGKNITSLEIEDDDVDLEDLEIESQVEGNNIATLQFDESLLDDFPEEELA